MRERERERERERGREGERGKRDLKETVQWRRQGLRDQQSSNNESESAKSLASLCH